MEPGGFIRSAFSATPVPEQPDGPSKSEPVRPKTVNRLTGAQENRLRTWIDVQFVELDRLFNERNNSGATFGKLGGYFQFIDPILSVILQIPPTPSSNPLRISSLQRLTLDLIDRIQAYPRPSTVTATTAPPPPTPPAPASVPSVSSSEPEEDELNVLFRTFRIFDDAWSAVLFGLKWDVNALVGYNDNGLSNVGEVQKVVVDETTRTIVRSLLANGRVAIEEWFHGSASAQTGNDDGEEVAVQIKPEIRAQVDAIFMKSIEVLEGRDEIGEEDEDYDFEDRDMGVDDVHRGFLLGVGEEIPMGYAPPDVDVDEDGDVDMDGDEDVRMIDGDDDEKPSAMVSPETPRLARIEDGGGTSMMNDGKGDPGLFTGFDDL